MSIVQAVAVITTKPGKRDEVLEMARANLANVHAEEGCIEYAPSVDADGWGSFQTQYGPDTFVFLEKWESADHLKAHAAAPHMKAYGEKTKDLLESRVIHILTAA